MNNLVKTSFWPFRPSWKYLCFVRFKRSLTVAFFHGDRVKFRFLPECHRLYHAAPNSMLIAQLIYQKTSLSRAPAEKILVCSTSKSQTSNINKTEYVQTYNFLKKTFDFYSLNLKGSKSLSMWSMVFNRDQRQAVAVLGI